MKRQVVHEIMDQVDLDPHLHQNALQGLRRINWFSRSGSILWPTIRALAKELSPRPLRVLDLATGGGDLPIELQQRAEAERLPIQFEGCDRSSVAIAFATDQAHRQGSKIRFFVHDVFSDASLDRHDVVMASLFLHHQPTEQEARHLLTQMANLTNHLVLVNDLLRHPAHYLLAQLACRFLTRSSVVHYDGPASVRAAFTRAEVLHLAEEAGLRDVTLSLHWPFRFLLSWRKPCD